MARPVHVFIFVNPTSGGNRAAEYLQGADSNPLEVKEVGAFLYRYNIKDGDPGQKPGFLLVKELSKQVEGGDDDSIRVLVGGGDGTVMWALSELIRSEVDMANVAVGHIPFGTANDFARTTGWGHEPPANLVGANMEYLKADMRRWINADISSFDMWQVDIQTSPTGSFVFIKDGKKVLEDSHKAQHGLTEAECGGMRMTKPMVNYFSFGFSERAGIGFEKNRTKSKFRNILRYGLEGAKKMLFRPPPKVSDVLQDLTIGEDNPLTGPPGPPTTTVQNIPGGDLLRIDEESTVVQPLSNRKESTKSFTSTIEVDHTTQGKPHFTTVSANLLFINIPSYCGGADPWSWSAQNGVLENAESSQDLLKCKQDFGDGKLELLSYGSGLSVSIDAINSKARVPGRGGGKRIASHPGPFVAKFKPPEKAKYKSKAGRVYFQIDGEFFIVTQPQTVVVSHWRTVRVLKCDEPPVRVGCAGCAR